MEAKSKQKNSSSSTSSVNDSKENNELKVTPKTSMAIEDDEDIISIPDSFDEAFNQNSRTADSTELVSMVIEGLESNNDCLSFNTNENGSGDKSKSVNESLMVTDMSLEKSRHFTDVGVQVTETPRRLILHNVSVQCTVSQMCNSAQTDDVVTPNTREVTDKSSDCCESNNCCFHKFIETIPCTSLKTFLKTLMELKASAENDTTLTNLPMVTDSEPKLMVTPSVETKVDESLKPEQPISSFAADHSSSMDSIPSSIPSEQKTTNAKKQNKPKPKPLSTEEKTSAKRQTSVQSKSKTKKIEANNEEMEVMQTESVPELSVVSNLIQIDSSISNSQTNGESEEPTDIRKPRIKGPKSRQNRALKKATEEVREEPKTKPKPPKVYISSDSEEENLDKTEDIKLNKVLAEEKANKNKSKGKTGQNSLQNKKTTEKPLFTDTTSDEMTVDEKQTKTRKQITKRSTTSQLKTSKKQKVDELAQEIGRNLVNELTEKSNNENVYQFTDEKSEQMDSNDTKQRNKRKTVPKKRFHIEDPKSEENDPEEIINNSKAISEIDDKPNDSTKSEGKVTKYKPKPKSKQKQVLANNSDDDGFKRPKLWTSPTPSLALSEVSTSSSSSRNRGSSTERSKKIILFSGLDEKQKKKIENVCRELNAEAVSDWTDKVTHLVIALAEDRPKKDLICPRNAKYIKALLHNSWIVSYDWITDSSRSDRFVDESPYEIKADKTTSERGLPNVSRSSGQKLFAKRMVKFEGKFGSLLTEFKEFVEIGGGVVVQSEEEFDNRKPKSSSEKLIIVTEAVGLPNTQKDGTKYVSKKAFMESISSFVQI